MECYKVDTPPRCFIFLRLFDQNCSYSRYERARFLFRVGDVSMPSRGWHLRLKRASKNFKLYVQHDTVLYEPGKCIKCGLCIQITEKEEESLGLTFVGRGFDVIVGVPFNETIKKGLEKTAKKCVEACPTAALALREHTQEI